MKNTFLAMLCAAPFALTAQGASLGKSGRQSKAEAKAPTYEEIRAQQNLGRVIASPTGSFFLYEWMRPYNWVRDTGKLPAAAADRMQAWLYKVDVDITPTTSQYLFHPGSGSSYWLGDLSPDLNKVAFYELDNDTNTVKAGVWDMAESKLTWFDVVPDAARMDQPAAWVSPDEVAYPAKSSGAQFVRGNVSTGVARPCPDCGSMMKNVAYETPGENSKAPALTPAMAHSVDSEPPLPGDLASSASVLAKSAQGDLAIYAKDTPDELTLIFRKGSNEPETVFENKRR
jgi:hypothetical protein